MFATFVKLHIYASLGNMQPVSVSQESLKKWDSLSLSLFFFFFFFFIWGGGEGVVSIILYASYLQYQTTWQMFVNLAGYICVTFGGGVFIWTDNQCVFET